MQAVVISAKPTPWRSEAIENAGKVTFFVPPPASSVVESGKGFTTNIGSSAKVEIAESSRTKFQQIVEDIIRRYEGMLRRLS